jgi:hypothetical protein
MNVVWTDPLEGMEALSAYAHVPEWLTRAHQQRYDQWWVFHKIAKGETLWAQHVGSDDHLDRPDVPDWPTPRQIEAAAEREDEWRKLTRIRAEAGEGTHVPVTPARPDAGLSPGRTVKSRHVPRISTFAGISVPCWTVGNEEILQCLHCSETWIRKVERGRKPKLCPDCRG